ncbi:hypothetical protein AB0M20_27860 [Actinoplanes sp. NPDC051633]|uniref:hypothetical protein n=1 Tax=Actinoplanes sp. NPDC051633 TaxID=3155670 RepID=UPI0034339377
MSVLMVTASVSLFGVPADSPLSITARHHPVPRQRPTRRAVEPLRAPVETAVEVARGRIRRSYRLEAAQLLDRCMRARREDGIEDQALAERWAYAQDRLTGNGRTSLQPAVLQRVIAWVTREELAATEQALAADRPFAAARFALAADRIDDRGTRSAFLHARALYRAAEKSLARAAEVGEADARAEAPDAVGPADFTGLTTEPPGSAGPSANDPRRSATAHLQRADRCLRKAIPMILRASADPGLRLECDYLSDSVERRLHALTERRASTDRMAAACACLVDYDAFVRHYADQALRSPADRSSFRSSLTALAARIDRLLARSPAGSAEARLLTTLAAGVANMQRAFTV